MTAPTYQGEPDNITIPAAVNIASSTNATPIIIQTSAPHGILDGTRVTVKGHQTNTAANGIRQVGFVDSTHLKLLGTVGNGVGGATGTVQGFNFGAVTLVDGSVPPIAGAFNTPPEFLSDVASLLMLNMGIWKMVDIWTQSIDSDTGAQWDSFTLTADNTYTQSAGGVFWGSGGTTNPLSNQPVDFCSGDLLIYDMDLTAIIANAGGANPPPNVELALFSDFHVPGGAFTSPTRVDGSARWLNRPPSVTTLDGSASSSQSSIRLAGAQLVPGGQSMLSQLKIQARSPNHLLVAGGLVSLIGDYLLTIKQYRSYTAFPQ